MKKLLLVITVLLILLILSSLVFAKLSDETLELVNDLRWKHYGYGTLDITGVLSMSDAEYIETQIEWTRDFFSMWIEDGILYVETQDGKWSIEMEKEE